MVIDGRGRRGRRSDEGAKAAVEAVAVDAVVDRGAVDVDREEMRAEGGTTGRAVVTGGDRRGTPGERLRRRTAVGIDETIGGVRHRRGTIVETIDGVRRLRGTIVETIDGVHRRRDITTPGDGARREAITTREAGTTTIDTRVDRHQVITTIVTADIIRRALRRADHRRRTTMIADASRLEETRTTVVDHRRRVKMTLVMDPRTFWTRGVTMVSSLARGAKP